MRGLMQLTGLLLPAITHGTVFEGQNLTECSQIIGIPFCDLPPGADAVGEELVPQHFFDAFDPCQVISRFGWELRCLVGGLFLCSLLIFQPIADQVCCIEPLLAPFQTAAGQSEPGEVWRCFFLQLRDAAQPIIPLLRQCILGRSLGQEIE